MNKNKKKNVVAEATMPFVCDENLAENKGAMSDNNGGAMCDIKLGETSVLENLRSEGECNLKSNFSSLKNGEIKHEEETGSSFKRNRFEECFQSILKAVRLKKKLIENGEYYPEADYGFVDDEDFKAGELSKEFGGAKKLETGFSECDGLCQAEVKRDEKALQDISKVGESGAKVEDICGGDVFTKSGAEDVLIGGFKEDELSKDDFCGAEKLQAKAGACEEFDSVKGSENFGGARECEETGLGANGYKKKGTVKAGACEEFDSVKGSENFGGARECEEAGLGANGYKKKETAKAGACEEFDSVKGSENFGGARECEEAGLGANGYKKKGTAKAGALAVVESGFEGVNFKEQAEGKDFKCALINLNLNRKTVAYWETETWVKFFLKSYFAMDMSIEYFDRIIDKYAVNSFYYATSMQFGSTMNMFETMIDLVERKKEYIYLRRFCNRLKNELSDLEFKVVEHFVNEVDNLNQICEHVSRRTVYRMADKIVSKLSKFLLSRGYTPEWCYDMFGGMARR